MATEQVRETGSGIPDDPEAFVARAEQLTNTFDLEGALSLYADTATVEVIADGAREVVEGREAIRASLEEFSGGLQAAGFWCRKQLLSAAGDMVVNEWTGGFSDRGGARGIETWRFDGDGKVIEHRLYTFFAVQPAKSVRGALGLAISAPRLAAQLARAQLAALRRR